jgi:hypothetical protein
LQAHEEGLGDVMLKLVAACLIGFGLFYAAQHLREASLGGPAAGQAPFAAAQIAPIPGLDPSPSPISENLHQLGKPNIQPLDLGDANARAAASEFRRLDEQGVSGSWAFPRNHRP